MSFYTIHQESVVPQLSNCKYAATIRGRTLFKSHSCSQPAPRMRVIMFRIMCSGGDRFLMRESARRRIGRVMKFDKMIFEECAS